MPGLHAAQHGLCVEDNIARVLVDKEVFALGTRVHSGVEFQPHVVGLGRR